jgi:copper chaperone CopZ
LLGLQAWPTGTQLAICLLCVILIWIGIMTLKVGGMHCRTCEKVVENFRGNLEGLWESTKVRIFFFSLSMEVMSITV